MIVHRSIDNRNIYGEAVALDQWSKEVDYEWAIFIEKVIKLGQKYHFNAGVSNYQFKFTIDDGNS